MSVNPEDYFDWSERIVRRMYQRQPTVLDDLYQEAKLAVVQAARNFDPDRGVHFSVYARVYVEGAVRQYVAKDETIRPPYKVIRSSATSELDMASLDDGTFDRTTYVERGFEDIEAEDEGEWAMGILKKWAEVFNLSVEETLQGVESGDPRFDPIKREIRRSLYK